MVRGVLAPNKLGRGGGQTPVVLLGATLLVCFLTVAAYFALASRSAPKAPVEQVSSFNTELVEVLVPIEKVEVGAELKPSMFRKEPRVAGAIPPSTLRSFDPLRGAYAASFMPAGQPVVSEYLTSKPPGGLIEAELADGYRAVSISVDSTTGVEGWARPGARVDVLLASMVGGKPALTLILQNLEVLSAGRSALGAPTAADASVASSVTLRVRKEHAAKLQLAANSGGSLSLALRGDEDSTQTDVGGTIQIDTLLGGGPSAPAPVPPEGRVKIDGRYFKMIHGKLVPEDEIAR